jgi:hypothetical protein
VPVNGSKRLIKKVVFFVKKYSEELIEIKFMNSNKSIQTGVELIELS